MDEQRLSQLFRDAVGDLPPASFGLDEVVTASRRATAVRRNVFLGGALLSVGVLAGTLVASGLVGGSQLPGETSSAGQAAPEIDAPGPEPGTHPLNVPPGGAQPAPRADPAGAERGSCGPVDHELAGELTALLADHGAPASGPADEVPRQGTAQPCPPGSRAAAVPVPGGTLYVVLVPQGDLFDPVETAAPDGTRRYAVTLNDGQLAVVSVPAGPGQPAPLADEVPELAKELASRR
ncbi:MAG: hypothetical protein ABR608_02010 [Pseudonocardiaceae bacterium]